MKQLPYIITAFWICCLCSCKKNNATAPRGETFFKVYPGLAMYNIPKYNGTIATCAGMIATDKQGNLYTYFYDTSSSDLLVIVKTDKRGTLLWKKKFPRTFGDGYYHSNTTGVASAAPFDDFICDGANIYFTGWLNDTDVSINKLDLDGRLVSNIPLNDILPPGYSRRISGMRLTNDNNLMMWIDIVDNNTLPSHVTALYTTTGVKIWSRLCKNDVSPASFVENKGGYLFACDSDMPSPVGALNAFRNYIYFARVDKSGNMLSNKFCYSGIQLVAGSVVGNFYRNAPYIFNCPAGGYVVACKYTTNLANSIQLLKLDTSLNIIDSAIISVPPNGVYMTTPVQKSNGDIVIAANIISYSNLVANKQVVYDIDPGLTIRKTKYFQLPNVSVYFSSTCVYADFLAFAGAVQYYGRDTANLMIIKTDLNEDL